MLYLCIVSWFEQSYQIGCLADAVTLEPIYKHMSKYIKLHFRGISLYIICVFCLQGLGVTLQAQQSRLDSMLQSLPSRMQSHEPAPVPDPTFGLRRDTALRENALLRYYKQGQSDADLSKSSILASRLLVPLVVQYASAQDLKRYSRGLGFDSLPALSLQPSTLGVRWTDADLRQYLYRYALAGLQREQLGLFRYGSLSLMQGREMLSVDVAKQIKSVETESVRSKEHIQDVVSGIKPLEVRYRYWFPSFESTAQLSQSYLSDNWYKGGASTLNIYMRTYFGMTYRKDKVEWLNELENKLSMYSTVASGSTNSQYRISDDLIRLRSNFGLRAKGRFYYTLDAEARTQLFHTYKDAERTKLQTAPFAPFNLNVGLGMKYDYSYRSKEIYKRSFSISANVAPLSFSHRSSARTDIDLARQGLSTTKLSTQTFGSTLRSTMKWQFNMNLSWESRLYFNTSYKHVEAEWENTINMSLTRYFSTRLNLYLRYDDSVKPAESWHRYLQISQLISFGFNYKL